MVPMFDLHHSSRRLYGKEQCPPGEGRDLDWATPKHLAVDRSLRLWLETRRIQSWRGFNLWVGGGVHLADLFRMEHKCLQIRGTVIDDAVSDISFSLANLQLSPMSVRRYLTFLLT